MASAIEDVSSLPGETVSDQDGMKIGKIKQLYSAGEGKSVMWVTVETSIGIGNKREVFVPLARLKQESDEIRVPYSSQHIQSAPAIDAGGELSAGEERALRDYYSIDLADQELRTDNDSYAGQVQEEEGNPRQIDAGDASEPERDRGEARERMRSEDSDSQSGNDGDHGALRDKPRKATADDLFES
jgi:sporulation protein YlmC with PRC-barrel domain